MLRLGCTVDVLAKPQDIALLLTSGNDALSQLEKRPEARDLLRSRIRQKASTHLFSSSSLFWR